MFLLFSIFLLGFFYCGLRKSRQSMYSTLLSAYARSFSASLYSIGFLVRIFYCAHSNNSLLSHCFCTFPSSIPQVLLSIFLSFECTFQLIIFLHDFLAISYKSTRIVSVFKLLCINTNTHSTAVLSYSNLLPQLNLSFTFLGDVIRAHREVLTSIISSIRFNN